MDIFLFLKKFPFFNKVFVLFLGAGLAQVVNLILTTILTRIFYPEQFGLLALFLTIATFLSVIATGRYELAILLPKDETKAQKLVKLALSLTLCFCLAATLFFLFYSKASAIWLRQPLIQPWLFLVPIGILLISGGWIFNTWSVRKEKFKLLSIARVGEAIISGVSSIVLKILGTTGLIIGNLIGPLFTALVLSFPFFSKDNSIAFQKADFKQTAYEYSAFPRINILQSLFDLFQFSGIILLCSFFFSAEVAGFYALCLRILQAPMGLIIKPVAQVYFSEASKTMHREESLYNLTYKTALRTALVALPIPIVILAMGPFLFAFIFGSHWVESGWYARIFVLWFYFDFIRSPISQITILLQKQSQMLLISLFGNLLLIASLFVITKLALDIHTGFLVVSVVQVIYTLLVIQWLISLSKPFYRIESNGN
jgi:O-antigen/teichoic acid export membrane protein